jgi:tripartite-type tricarboxylate transporter receptor subunit TctC
MKLFTAGFSIAALAASLAVGGNAMAQAYPARNITFLVNAVGAAPDAIERTMFDKIKETTGANLVLENRVGGGGAVGLQALKRAAPDGYTLGITFASALTLNPLINKDVDIDPFRDFAPVTNIMTLGSTFVVREDFPAKDLKEFLALAKAKPNTLRFGIWGAGTKLWLAQLGEATGASFIQVPLKSSAESIPWVLGDHIDSTVESPGIINQYKGKLRAIATGSPVPYPQLPGVRTVRQDFGVDMMSWMGVLAPVGTPAAAVNWVQRELARAAKDPKVVKLAEESGWLMQVDTPDEFAKTIRAEWDGNSAILKKYPDIR